MVKKSLSLLILAILIISCNNKNDESQIKLLESISSNIQQHNPIYEIYPTQNIWNFIKLDTRNGKMWIDQFSVDDDDKRVEVVLSDESRVSNDKPGRFKLHPTQNIYNFILLDQVSGKTYQVQWGFEQNQRFVIPIY